MNICLAAFDRVPAGKGASAHIQHNLRALAAEHDVALISLGDAPLPGVRHRTLRLAEPNWWLRGHAFRHAVAAIVDDEPFDAFHVRSPWEGLAVRPDRPIVYEVNALYSIEVGAHYPAVADRPALRERLRRHERCLFERAARIVTPSRVTADHLAALGVGAARVEVIANAPSIELVEEAPPRPASGALRLVYIGSLAPWQGLRELIATLAPRPAWTLDVYTEAHKDARAELRKLARKLGLAERVAIREPVPPAALGAALAAYDAGVAPLVPSERNLVQGCQPIKILDYAAAGLAVLAPDMPVVTEIVGADYPLYDRWSRADLVRGFEALRDPAARAELAARGRALARDRAAAQRRLLLDLYRGLG